MNQSNPSQAQLRDEAPKVYDPTGLASAKERVPLAFRIMGYVPSTSAEEPDVFNRFHPEDQVKVVNILDHMFYWQVEDPHNEQIREIAFRGATQRRISRKAPDMWSIAPGEVKVIPGWSALLMIEKMYKQYIIETTDAKPRPETSKGRLVQSYNFDNASKQEEIISKIFLGIETPGRGQLNYASSVFTNPDPADSEKLSVPSELPDTFEDTSREPVATVEELAQKLGIKLDDSQTN